MSAAKTPEKSEEKTEKSAKSGGNFRGRVYDSLLHTIGATPLVRLPRFIAKDKIDADLMGKMEFFNPLSSIKDRAAIAMFEVAEREGKITPGKTVLIEPSGGNFAVSVAFIAAARGYRLILVMPESAPLDRRKLLTLYGAEIVLTPANLGSTGAAERAKEIAKHLKEKESTESFSFGQFDNKAGILVHANTTAEEIWADTGGKVDVIIAGVGSGATITGIAGALKKKKPGIRAYAVEPAESPVLSGGKAGPHKIHGIGAGFVPPILDTKLIDGVVKITTERAYDTAREIAKLDGVPAGISSGAVLAAAIDVAKLPDVKGKMIVAILASGAERYLSSALFDEYKR